MEWRCSHSGWVSPSQLILPGSTLIDIFRGLFPTRFQILSGWHQDQQSQPSLFLLSEDILVSGKDLQWIEELQRKSVWAHVCVRACVRVSVCLSVHTPTHTHAHMHTYEPSLPWRIALWMTQHRGSPKEQILRCRVWVLIDTLCTIGKSGRCISWHPLICMYTFTLVFLGTW